MKALNNAALTPHAGQTAPALDALVMRQPAVRSRALGVACSAFADSVWLVKSEETATQPNPALDQELVQAVHEWADHLLQVGVTILFAAAALSCEPIPQERQALTSLDVAALHEAMAAALLGTEVDPKYLVSVIRLARPTPTEAIMVELVQASQRVSEEVQSRLIDAIERWLQPRRGWFSWITRIHVAIDAQDHAALTGTEPIDAFETEADLMWMPAEGTA